MLHQYNKKQGGVPQIEEKWSFYKTTSLSYLNKGIHILQLIDTDQAEIHFLRLVFST